LYCYNIGERTYDQLYKCALIETVHRTFIKNWVAPTLEEGMQFFNGDENSFVHNFKKATQARPAASRFANSIKIEIEMTKNEPTPMILDF
jgi:hypothetical protein